VSINELAGTVNARSTPAIVACTPESRKSEPEPDPEQGVDESPVNPDQVGHHERREEHGPDAQSAPGNLRGVEERYHQHRHDVVHDGERRQEHLEGHRDPLSEQRQYAEGEGYVGGHGDAPARDALSSQVEGQVDQGRNRGPAHGCGHGQRGAAHGGQLAHEHLAFDLQPDDQEEDRHEPVVDPMRQILGQREVGHTYRQLGMPERRIALAPRRVGPDEGRDRGGDEEYAARGLLVGEVLERTYDLLHRLPPRHTHGACYTSALNLERSERCISSRPSWHRSRRLRRPGFAGDRRT
jgi:hypothetical protein